MIRAGLVWLALCGTALAEPLDTAEKFDAYVGKGTMFFHRGDGRVYAAETYLENRKVRWSLADGETCLDGTWWAQDGKICFSYDNNPAPQCWFVRTTQTGLIATSDAQVAPLIIYEAQNAEAKQLCQAPNLGV